METELRKELEDFRRVVWAHGWNNESDKALESIVLASQRQVIEARYAEAKFWEDSVIPANRSEYFDTVVKKRLNELQAELEGLGKR